MQVGINPFIFGSCQRTTPLGEITKMARSDRMLEWTMVIIRSFEGEAFTSHAVNDRWDQYASPRYKPNTSAMSALLRRLVAKGQIRKTGDQTRLANSLGSTEKAFNYREV